MRRAKPLLLAALLLSPCLSFGQSKRAEFGSLLNESNARIEEALQEYRAFLSQASDEKLELVNEINRLQNELVNLSSQDTEAERSAKNLEADLDNLDQRIKTLDTQSQYTSGVLSEFLTNFESRIHISEDQAYREPLLEIRKAVDDAASSSEDRIQSYFQAVEAGMLRQEELLGGKQFSGKAITPTGGVKEGQILLFGPSAYFHADDNSENGFLEFNPGTIEPGLKPFPAELSSRFAQLLQTGKGSLVIDASQGKANLLAKAKGSLAEHIEKGGWVGYTILALGGLSILIVIAKMLDLRAARISPPEDIGDLARTALCEGTEAGIAKIRSLSEFLSEMLITGIEFAHSDAETNLEAMEAIILKKKPRLQRMLPFLATTAAVAPLMGLLGTVVGMIKTFTLIEVFGTGDAKSLSSGISEALITTELGLVVAIPALVFHGIFTRMARSRVSTMEQIAADFSRQLSRESAAITDDQPAGNK